MTEILDTLKHLDETRGEEIERWFADKRKIAEPYLTTSVDLRHSGLRLAPVDTNLFPAGFNNLSPAARQRATRFLARFFEDHYRRVRRIVIIPENHTRNVRYLENLSVLLELFEPLGIEVRLGSLAAPPGQPIELEISHGKLIEYPLTRAGNKLSLEDGFAPDLILMNNDMTTGAPEILKELSQPVMAPVHMGWWQRRKSVHFAAYQTLAQEFAKKFSLDSWLIAAEFHRCGLVNFKESTGLDLVARGVEKVLAAARAKHAQYGIKEDPYVFVKAESGTYGMGIMTARAPENVLEINKKTRNKMNVIKEGAEVSEVIIQEGIPTIDRVNGNVAEPMIYMIDGVPVGGMWRANAERDTMSNLNAAGMEFTGMCDEAEDECGKWKSVEGCHFRSFGIIAAIAALASAREDYTVGREGAGI